MPGLVFTSYPLQEGAWEILGHHESPQFHSLKIPGAYCGRVCNGILNPGLGAIGKSIRVLMDGEFLNRRELWSSLHRENREIPSSDQELLMILLSEGCDLELILSQAEGGFTFLIHEPHHHRIRIASDRFGQRPHYWAQSGSKFVLGPELKFCIAQPWLEADFDPLSLAEYFNFQCVMEERTLFRGIDVFPAGSIGTYSLDTGSWEIRPYASWTDLVDEPFQGSFGEAVEEAAELFKNAIISATQGSHRSGIYLSGGLDSRQILAALSETRGLPTFSFGPDGSPDILYARKCARIAGTQHHEFFMENGNWLREIGTQHTQLSEGFHCLWHAHNLWQADVAGKSIDINLHGHFGDLLFGGSFIGDYSSQQSTEERSIETFQTRWGGAFSSLSDYQSYCSIEQNWSPPEVRSRFHTSFKPFAELPGSMSSDLFALHYHGRKQIQYYMVHNRPWFEARTPFLDLKLLRFLYSLPKTYRHNRRLQIAVLQRLNPKLAAVPWAKTQFPACGTSLDYTKHKTKLYIDRFLIAPITGRKRLTPWAPVFNQKYPDWITENLDTWLQELLCSKSSLNRELFEVEYIDQNIERLRQGTSHGTQETWLLGCSSTIELLHREAVVWRKRNRNYQINK